MADEDPVEDIAVDEADDLADLPDKEVGELDESQEELEEGETKEGDKLLEAPAEAEEKPEKDPLLEPAFGCEVFIGGLVREATEADIRDFVKEVEGEIHEVRLKVDPDHPGNNRGFAFVCFTTPEAAQDAIKSLNGKELKGRTVRIAASTQKNRIFLGSIPRDISEEGVRSALEEAGAAKGLEEVDIPKDTSSSSRNRGYAFLHYYNHGCAALAKNLLGKNWKLGDRSPTVSWAEPKREPDAQAVAKVKVVYLKGFGEGTTEDMLTELGKAYGTVERVMIPTRRAEPGGVAKPGNYGFIHFSTREEAGKCIEGIDKTEVNGGTIEAAFAKPASSSGSKSDAGGNRNMVGRGRDASLSSFGRGRLGGAVGTMGMMMGRGLGSGMAMVPMVLPNGQVGYVMQPSVPGMSQFGSYGAGGRHQGGHGRGRRYRPY